MCVGTSMFVGDEKLSSKVCTNEVIAFFRAEEGISDCQRTFNKAEKECKSLAEAENYGQNIGSCFQTAYSKLHTCRN